MIEIEVEIEEEAEGMSLVIEMTSSSLLLARLPARLPARSLVSVPPRKQRHHPIDSFAGTSSGDRETNATSI